MDAVRRAEAAERSRLLRVRSYDVELDLTHGEERFGSVSRVRFDCAEPGAGAFVDLAAARVESATLNGRALDASAIGAERIRLDGLDATNELIVRAECAYSREGEGMHRFVDPADGEVYVWTELGRSRALEADLDGALGRLLVEGRSELERALRTREVDRVPQPSQATVTSSA